MKIQSLEKRYYINNTVPSVKHFHTFNGNLKMREPERDDIFSLLKKGLSTMGEMLEDGIDVISDGVDELINGPARRKAEELRLERERQAKLKLEVERRERLRLERERELRIQREAEEARLAELRAKQMRKERVKDFFYDAAYFIGDAASFVKDKVVDLFDSIAYWYRWTAKDKIIDAKDFVVDKTSEAVRFVKEKTIDGYHAVKDWYISTGKDKITNLAEKIEEKSTAIVETFTGEAKERKLMMKSLEKQFRKGGNHYLPHRPLDSFNPQDLEDITPQEEVKSYREELDRMCAIYIRNTRVLDNSARGFNILSKNFFSNVAMSMKEIFAIGSDTRALERVPKLGIIPKALRFSEQLQLLKCVKDDYEEVTNWYVKDGLVPMIDKYNEQYKIIENFARRRELNNRDNKKHTRRCLKKIGVCRENRSIVCAKLLEMYSIAGANLTKVCNRNVAKGTVDLVRKAITTMVTFV